MSLSSAETSEGQRFSFLDDGEGPLVVLYHGFPDTPRSWDGIAAALAADGHRAVRPWLRGYDPSTHVEGRPYDTGTLSRDVLALLDALGEERAALVGHDWGAWMVYGAAALAPERVRGIVPIAISHPKVTPKNPSILWKARHMVNLNMPLAEQRARYRDFAYFDRLYRRWAPAWRGSERDATLARATEALRDPRALKAAVDHYRGLKDPPDPSITEPAQIPCLAVAGTTDLDPAIYRLSAEIHGPGSDALIVDGAGHWPHRENEPLFTDRLLAFLENLPR